MLARAERLAIFLAQVEAFQSQVRGAVPTGDQRRPTTKRQKEVLIFRQQDDFLNYCHFKVECGVYFMVKECPFTSL
jgi:hypothetical protein